MIDLTGQKFGRWTVQEYAGRIGNQYYWVCICDCGKTKKVQSGNLKSGQTKSCGCYHKELVTIHGMRGSGLYGVWLGMKNRCYNKKSPQYKNYGGRGIKVCERWHSFENFYEDMRDCPKGMSLDRRDNDGDYCKENCRWATREEQNNNTRANAWYEYKGERKTVAQWARSRGMCADTLNNRLKELNWSVKRALLTPVGGLLI